MGVFRVDCTVENLAAPDKSELVEQLLVHTGSEFTWIQGELLSKVGVTVRKRDEQFVMANGEIITRDIGYAIIRVNGFETVDEIVFAQTGDLNLLGEPEERSWWQQAHGLQLQQVDNLRTVEPGKKRKFTTCATI